MFCARLFICALWSPAGKGLTSWLSFVVSSVSLSLSHWYPGSGVVLDCIDSWSLQPYLLSFKGTWLSHLGVLRRLHTKLWYALNWSMQPPFGALIVKLRFNKWRRYRRTAARWTCRRWRNTSSVGEMLDELQWPTLEARRDQSSLLFFHKIHCGTMSIDKDKYLTLSQSTRSTRSSHNSQYCRPQTYSDALKYSFFPRTIPHWNSLAPSVVAAETTEEFRALI